MRKNNGKNFLKLKKTVRRAKKAPARRLLKITCDFQQNKQKITGDLHQDMKEITCKIQ
jgi:hypothetical protein